MFLWVFSTVARSVKAFDVAGRLLLSIITVLIDDRDQLERKNYLSDRSEATSLKIEALCVQCVP
jgi:hypothetical protein